MELKFALVADHVAETREGKLIIVGEFDVVWAPEIPAQFGPFYLVLRLEARVSEGTDHKIKVGLFDADGQEVIPMSPELTVRFGSTGPGYPLRAQITVHFAAAQFPAYGDYEFHIIVDGRFLGSVPIRVLRPNQPSRHGQA